VEVTVHAWGAERDAPPGGNPAVRSYRAWEALAGSEPYIAALQALSIDLAMTVGSADAEIVHSHTWYTNLAGHLSGQVHGVPHVATVHSLEPMRPWKAEQLGGGYALSCFAERTGLEHADAIIAVSAAMRADLVRTYAAVDPQRIHVIHNGIDTEEYRRVTQTDVLVSRGIDPERPTVLFVGRMTRQKGIAHLLSAAEQFDPAAQLVLVAGSPDTPELATEVAEHLERLGRIRESVIWIADMLPRSELVEILSQASVFVCPSVYEPLGIVNLEAMACEVPVVATDTGGIPEVVADGVSGLLVPFDPREDGSREPIDPAAFADAIAQRVNALLSDPGRAEALGAAGRRRAVDRFSWPAIARRTVALYRDVLSGTHD
jgi:starch synthase